MVGSSGDFSVSTTSDGGTATLTIAGELDMMTAPGVRAELIDAIDNFEHVVVDIGALDVVDSAGLATLLAARKRADAADRRLELIRPTPSFKKVAEIAGMAESLDVGAG